MTAIGDQTDELNISHLCLDSSDQYFYEVIGSIEDTLMDDKFIKLHADFLEKYWQNFESTEENKFIYMDIFKEYNETIEKFIQEKLIENVKNFNMERFENELKHRQNELDGEVFEILSTFTDFIAFKEMFLDYKAVKEGITHDLSKDVLISRCDIEIEQENLQ